jgi:hypothetical protein
LDRNPANGVEVVKQPLTDSGRLDGFEFGGNARYVKVFEFPSQEAALFDFMDKQVLPRFQALKVGGVTGR